MAGELIETNAAALAALVDKSTGDTLTAAEYTTAKDALQEANTRTRTANTVLAGPASGAAALAVFRLLVAADIPALAIAGITGLQAALDAKADEADLGDLATLDQIVNAQVAADAAIALSKLAAVTVDRALVSDGSGVVAPSAVTAAELAHVGGVTSALQAQLDAKQALHAILTALAALDNTAGLLEQTGASTFARRALGVGAATSVPTRADADTRYAAASHAHSAADLTSGTLPDARFPATLPAVSGANLTNLDAADLAAGTIPDARFPATLPAVSGANLTNLDASDLASGTIPDARFPATLPALNGSALTNLDASDLSSGTVPAARLADATLARFLPQANEPPASNFATADLRNGHPVLDFDDTTQEAAIFSSILPRSYKGAGVTVYVHATLTSATSGTLGWDVALERIGAAQQDIDADGFASAKTITAATVPGTSGHVLVGSVAFSDGAEMDSIAAGEGYRIRIRRDVASDNAAGDAELRFVEVVG